MLLITNDPNCFARMPRINFKGLGLFVLFGSFVSFVISTLFQEAFID